MTSRTMMDGKLNAPVGSASPPLNLSGHLRGTGRAGHGVHGVSSPLRSKHPCRFARFGRRARTPSFE
jgi:hypothetical protein